VGISACKNTVEVDMLDFVREIVFCEREYYALSEGTRAQLTFQRFVSIKNPRWSKDEVTHWVNIAEENRATTIRWREAQINPKPIRSRQRYYICKVPWEPDHRCRGRGKKHIIEVLYDSYDEVCEDAMIYAYLVQSDDASDSCTKASDSGTLEDSDPCALEEQWDGQDASTCVSIVISHSVDDLTPQQSGDTSGDSHVLAPRPDELPMMTVTHLSSFQTPMIATTHEDISGISGMIEESCVRDA
jgi:hypothetical protein